MLMQDIIIQKRDGGVLSDAAIGFFVDGLTRDTISEGQAAALAMAILLRGMKPAECASLTLAMAHSGTMMDWSHTALSGPRLDKHSTGGIGDNVSLILAPAVAACGGFVPMIAGRGLGHTGGTIDKLEAIPGFDTALDMERFRAIVANTGCAIIGQTATLAPADRRLYAIRDVTGTVESIPLITASILSKKLAAGLQGLVMDVKVGNGAFMLRSQDADALARSLVQVGTAAGLPMRALITDMDQPLASSAGNSLEVAHAIHFLTGTLREPRLLEVVLELGADMLVLGRLAESLEEGRTKIARALESGAAAQMFARMVAAQGGPHDLIENSARHLPSAPIQKPVYPSFAGYVAAVDTRALGLAIIGLGGGRTRTGDRIDLSVGLSHCAAIGAAVGPGHPLCVVHARTDDAALHAAERIRATYLLSPEPVKPPASAIVHHIAS